VTAAQVTDRVGYGAARFPRVDRPSVLAEEAVEG